MTNSVAELKESKMDKSLDDPKILMVGPLRDFSGYAEVARTYVRALDHAGMDVVTRDLTYDGGQYNRSDREKELSNKDIQDVDIVFQHTTPNETEAKDGVFNVNAFCWETDRIPKYWVDMLNQMDLVVVPIEQNRQAAQFSGVVSPIEVVPYATDPSKYDKDIPRTIIPGHDSKFKFLSIFQFSKKKGLGPLLKAYLSEFKPQDNVVLIIKVYIGPSDGEQEKQRVAELINVMKGMLRLKEYPPIYLIHQVLSHDDIARLYKSSDCYVLPSRGEGWGVPHMDALGYGLPAICTKGTGPDSFIDHTCGWSVESNWSPVCDMPHPHEFMYTGVENWREPHVCDLKMSMRDAYDLWTHRNRGPWTLWPKMQEAAKKRNAEYNYEIVGKKLKDTILKYYKLWRESNVR